MAAPNTLMGLARWQKRLQRIPDRARAEIKKALAESADEITAMQRQLVPVDSGDLRASIRWQWGVARGFVLGGVARGTVTLKGDIAISVVAGDDKAFYARWVEFGVAAQTAGTRITNRSGRRRKSQRTTAGQPAQPFFFPPYRALRPRIRRRIRKAMRRAAEASV